MEYQALHDTPWLHGSFWVAVAIIIFAVLFARKIAAPVAAMLDARTEKVRAALDEAARLKAEAETMLADAKLRQEQVAADAKQILESAHAEAARVGVALAAEAEANAKRREQMALQRIEAAEKSAVNDVRIAAIDIATTATAAILKQNLDGETAGAAVDRAIAGIPGALRQAV